ncbi:MAG: Uma2 family endonuclease [Jaaginema sp. PMC 1079.18]|nr:Uma2 family endonuclease [Jaaginema sp. PMC 1080.18]MEC4851121.1 Uma2 family endonuclease [Jaaginema sp. PMC 1079.18]MEC4868237.1 Uma2 family endonuclease [Jaaginema sp. PMC 1078.18]
MVGEYWLCDRDIPKLEIYRRENAQLQLVATLYPDDEITSPLLPDFSCRVSLLFPSR